MAFKAYGAYFQGQGGPDNGQTIPAVKALFEGSLSTAQDQMKLTVSLLDGKSIGFFFLVKGKNGTITQCL